MAARRASTSRAPERRGEVTGRAPIANYSPGRECRGDEASAAATPTGQPSHATAKSCIYIFLSGGLAQHESFDLKPDAPDGVRGEFRPMATATPGIQICEHLPGLARRSRHWAVVRSLTHPSND